MMLIFKNADVFAPESLGKKDILVAADKIISIADTIEPVATIEFEIFDCAGLKIIPGLIDGHVHFAGAGGEGGPATRTPEMQLGDLISGGVTTAIGMLGTDGYSRAVQAVLMKARALQEDGMSAFILTGAYQIPAPSITGDVAQDMILINEVLGAGEIAVSDHRDSAPTWQELARLAKKVRVAGMIAGKAGVVCLHIGDAPRTFDIVVEAVTNSHLPWKHLLPTHCNRTEDVFDRAVTYARRGGFVDITTSAYPFFPDEEVKPSTAVSRMIARGVPVDHICLSSDAGGSLPAFDEQGNLLRLDTGKSVTIFNEIRDLVQKENMPLETALRFATANVALLYGLRGKGQLRQGADADLVVIDEQLSLKHVVARGKCVIRDGKQAVFGKFERIEPVV